MTDSSALFVVASIVFFALGAGMVYVTWINPSSRFYKVFCARWRLFGRVASKFGAAAQATTLLSLGLLIWLSFSGSSFTKAALVPLVVGVVLTSIARLGDLRDDEA